MERPLEPEEQLCSGASRAMSKMSKEKEMPALSELKKMGQHLSKPISSSFQLHFE